MPMNANPGDTITTIYDVLPGDDFDGDSFSNYEEWLNNTDPTAWAAGTLPGPRTFALVCAALVLMVLALREMGIQARRRELE